MCIASPGQVQKISGATAEVDFGGVRRNAETTLVPTVKKGDYVLVHAGFIITVLEKKDALERIKLFKETGQ